MSLHTQYARPRSLEQAIALLDALSAGTMLIAGGQELMPHINYGRVMPAVLVDIGALPELTGVREEDGALSIGALTVHRDIQDDPLVISHAALLAEAAGQIGGGWQVHNRGTIGGNIVAMHPLYDVLPALLVLEAEVEVVDAAGKRCVPLARLMTETRHGLGTTAILTRVLIPTTAKFSGQAYCKLKLMDGSYGSANAAAGVTIDSRGAISALRVAIGAATSAPIDVSEAMRQFTGKVPDARLFGEIEALGSAAVTEPVSDQRGDGSYRRAMAGVMARRAVATAMERAA